MSNNPFQAAVSRKVPIQVKLVPSPSQQAIPPKEQQK